MTRNITAAKESMSLFCSNHKREIRTALIGSVLALSTASAVWTGKRVHHRRQLQHREAIENRRELISKNYPEGYFLSLEQGYVFYEIKTPVIHEQHQPLAVFIGHPTVRSSDFFGNIANELTMEHRIQCFLFDFLGSGNSDMPSKKHMDYSTEGYTKQLKNIISELEFEDRDLILITHPLSIEIAASFSTIHNDKCRAVIIVDYRIKELPLTIRTMIRTLATLPVGISFSIPGIENRLIEWHVFKMLGLEDGELEDPVATVMEKHMRICMQQNKLFYPAQSAWAMSLQMLLNQTDTSLSALNQCPVDLMVITACDETAKQMKSTNSSALVEIVPSPSPDNGIEGSVKEREANIAAKIASFFHPTV